MTSAFYSGCYCTIAIDMSSPYASRKNFRNNPSTTDMARLDRRFQLISDNDNSSLILGKISQHAVLRRFLMECRKSRANGMPGHELALAEYMIKTATDEERVYAFEWERIPHIATNSRKRLPVELLQKISAFVLDSSISNDLFVHERSGKAYVRGLANIPDMLRTGK